MEGDISNKTIVVLVVLTVIISILSTLVVLNEVLNMNADTFAQKSPSNSADANAKSQVGYVKLKINPEPENVQAVGYVTFRIHE